MDSLTNYFAKRSKPVTYHCGDRVFGFFHKIPFIGSVGVEHLVSEQRGTEVVVMLDLPLWYKDQYLRMVTVKPKDLKPLIKLDQMDSTSAKPKTKVKK